MLSIAHAATGALIFSKFNPLLAVPLTLTSHYLEDYILHWDVGQGLSKKLKSKRAAFLQEIFIDLPASVLLVYLFFNYKQPFSILPWLGWFFALLPDFLEFPFLFLGWKFFPIKEHAKFHKFFHRSTPQIFRGLIPQIVTIVLVYILR